MKRGLVLSLVICLILVTFTISFVSAHQYIADENFGSIQFNTGSIEEGITADAVDFDSTLFPNFINGASARYTILNASYDQDVYVMVAEFQDDISFEDFKLNYVDVLTSEGNYDLDYDPANVGSSLPDAQILIIGSYIGRNGDILTSTYSWVSSRKFISISFEDFRSIEGISDKETDFHSFLTAYIEKHPSTLVEEVSCSDTDDGKNYFVKGYLNNHVGVNFEDYCLDANNLIERHCLSNDPNAFTEQYECLNGCENGACIENSGSCTDTDGGKDYFVKGYLNNHVGVNFEDYCLDANNLIERHCLSDDPNAFTEQYECLNGCQNGACIKETISCTDSDGGKKYYIKGYLNNHVGVNFEDYCLDSDNLIERHCLSNDSNSFTEQYKCPNGCEEGACICYDTDGGKNYFVKGYLNNHVGVNFEDYCLDANNLIERHCLSNDPNAFTEQYECPNGCNDGICNKTEPKEEPEEIPEEFPEEEQNKICTGCVKDNKCFPINYRTSDEYCSGEDEIFITQKEPKNSCNNNFECDSNLCINDECVSGSLWAKFIRWFSRIFG